MTPMKWSTMTLLAIFFLMSLFVSTMSLQAADSKTLDSPGPIPTFQVPSAPTPQPGDDQVVSTTIGHERQALYWKAVADAALKQLDIDHTYMLAQKTYIDQQAVSREELAKKFEKELQAEQNRSAFRATVIHVMLPVIIAETAYIALRLITGR